MAILDLTKALYLKMSTSGFPVSTGLRRAGDSTPAVIYEITQIDIDFAMRGVASGSYTMQVSIDCVANTALEAWDVASEMITQLDTNVVDNVNNISFIISTATASARTEVPDDGQSDAERVVTLVLTILAKEI